MPSRPPMALIAAVLTALLMGNPAAADSHDPDALLQAVERGEIRPLADLLDAIRGQLPGEVIGVEVERKNGYWLYELRVLDTRGRLYEVHVDARNGKIGRIREK